MNPSQVVIPFHNRNANRRGPLVRPALTIAGISCSVGLLLLIAAQGNSDVMRMTESPTESYLRTGAPSFEYFPAQYRSDAHGVSPEPHIQAF